MTDVIVVGEPMGLFMADTPGSLLEAEYFTRSVSGAEVNVGIGLSRLDYSVEFVSKLGDDLMGNFIADYLKREQISTTHVSFDANHITGLQMKNKVTEGDPEVAYFRKNSAFTTLSLEDVESIDFSKVRLFHVTGIPPAVSLSARESIRYLMKKAHKQGCLITFDPNLRPSLWENTETMVAVLNELAGYADVVLPGISEGEVLTRFRDSQKIADFYLASGSKAVIIKNGADGADGALVAENDKEMQSVPGFPVEKVVDTVGAGDGFAVGVLSGILDGLSFEKAAERGNAIGSIQVQHAGDNEGLPVWEELKAYIKQNQAQRVTV